MVLEEVSSDPDPYFSPSSYDDPSNSAPPTPQIDPSHLPQPIPFASAWGFSASKLQKGIAIEQSNAETLLKRPLTTPEADAIAFHYAKGYRYASFGPPVGVAAGIWRASTTATEMRWPLLPKSWAEASQWKFDKETHELGFKDMKVAKGEWVRPGILGLRGLVYVSFGYAISGFLFRSYGATVAAVGGIQDPRLKGIREMVRGDMKRRSEELSQTQPPKAGTKKEKIDPMGQGERNAGESWRNHRVAIAKKEDDASPTAGNDDFFSDEADNLGANGVVMNDGQMRNKQRRQQPSPRRSPTENRASTFQMERTERQPQSPSDDYSTMSPTSDGQSPASASAGGESVWDRIRRENASSGVSASPQVRRQRQDRVQQEQQENSTVGDSFSFSSADSERSYAKDDAQKHFDERVEQERRGEDFGSGRNRRW